MCAPSRRSARPWKSCSWRPPARPAPRAKRSGGRHDRGPDRPQHVSRGDPRPRADRGHPRRRRVPALDPGAHAFGDGPGQATHRGPRAQLDLDARLAGGADGGHEPGGEGDRAPHHLQPVVASDRALHLPGGEVGGTDGGGVGDRRGAGRGVVGGHGAAWIREPGWIDRRGHLPGGARAGGDHRDRGDVLGALDSGAVGALHVGPVPGGTVVQRPPRLRDPVPSDAGGDHEHPGQSGSQSRPVQHASAGLSGTAHLAAPPRPRDRLRLALLRVRAGARDRGLRVARLQVIPRLPAEGPRLRMMQAWMVALVTGALAYGLAVAAYQRLPHPMPLEELSYYPSGHHLRPATLGHAETAADLAWLRAVQYYGEHRRTDLRFENMEHVFDILTSLSPGFVQAYVFGAFALAQEGFDFAQAERLMLKGIENNPRSGYLAFELGFLYYVRPGERQLRQAADFFEQAARQPDAPPQAARFAAFARQHAGDLRVAFALWLDVYQHSNNKLLREMAEREMTKIQDALATGRTDLAVKPLATPRIIIKE